MMNSASWKTSFSKNGTMPWTFGYQKHLLPCFFWFHLHHWLTGLLQYLYFYFAWQHARGSSLPVERNDRRTQLPLLVMLRTITGKRIRTYIVRTVHISIILNKQLHSLHAANLNCIMKCSDAILWQCRNISLYSFKWWRKYNLVVGLPYP